MVFAEAGTSPALYSARVLHPAITQREECKSIQGIWKEKLEHEHMQFPQAELPSSRSPAIWKAG
jgi:hypothetical protein